jgi:Tol biopolymer transport system component
MRRLLLIVVCFLPFVLSLSSANGSSPPVGGKIVYSSDLGPNVGNAEIYSVGVDGSGRRNLSRNQRNEAGFAWSPTGDRIAFTAYRSDSCGGLYVMRADGTEQQCLAPADLYVFEPPTWSPDGRWIAFSAYRGSYGIWVVGADGRDLRLVAEGGHSPVWAPVGNRIAFIGLVPEWHFTLQVVDADGSGRTPLAGGQVISAPTWSPDGRELAYIRAEPPAGGRVLYRVDAGGGAETAVVGGGDLDLANPVWSPQGRLIAFTEGQVIKTVDVNGGAPKALVAGARPAWSPNGSQIAFVRDTKIFVANVDGTGRRKVQDETPARITEGLEWSPDGKTLLFASMRPSADHEIFVANADGSQRRQLTRNNIEDLLPAWSSHHTRIAFARGRGSGSSIWVMSASGTRQHRLALGTHPGWSPSGSRIVFERRGVIYTMTDRGRSVRRITRGEQPAWAPRGTRIAFVRGTKLLVADADSAAVRRLEVFGCAQYGEGDRPDPILSSPEWSPSARRLVVPLLCDYEKSFYASAEIVATDGGGVTGQVPIDLNPSSRVAWSPDGTRLAFLLMQPLYRDAPRIVTTPLDGSSMTTVSTGAGDDRDPDW